MNLLLLPEEPPKTTYQTRQKVSCFIVPGLHLIINEALTLSCNACGIDKSQIKNKTRKREYAYARFIVMKILNDYTIMSLQHIGGTVFDPKTSDQLHGSVLHGIKEVEKAIWCGKNNISSELYDKYIQVETVFNSKYKKELLSPDERTYQRIRNVNG